MFADLAREWPQGVVVNTQTTQRECLRGIKMENTPQCLQKVKVK